MRPGKQADTVQRAKRLRRAMSLPEVLLWKNLRGSPQGLRFRNQHPAGDFMLDFFCARANLAVEIDGIAHEMGDRPARDIARDAWLRMHRIDVLRIPARDVLGDPEQVAEGIVTLAAERLVRFGKTPLSWLRDVTSSPSLDQHRIDGETQEAQDDSAFLADAARNEIERRHSRSAPPDRKE